MARMSYDASAASRAEARALREEKRRAKRRDAFERRFHLKRALALAARARIAAELGWEHKLKVAFAWLVVGTLRA